ncbi:MAG: tetratricopeptide repeat protein [Woeseiaceae bacterium]|jgi:adenylate cyclase|nr:tetratricopeptide repeat protein [Woeseiaceae bacterium]
MKINPFPDVLAFLEQLRRRKVYRAMAAYAVVGWLVLQIGEVTFEPLGLPGWVMTALVVVVILGFPVTVILSWVFDITWAGIRREDGETAAPAGRDAMPSIAVLPFADMSPGQDQRFFCEGIAEEILNALTRIEDLHVVARSSAFQYADIGVDVRRVGKDLGVRTVLEGSVRKSGEHLRITAQLVDVVNGYHLWSKTFDEHLEDVFAIQDEIARSIAQSLLDTIGPRERSAIKTTSSSDVTAYEFYLRGRHFMHRFRKTHIEFARQMFREAIDADPNFALAWAGYADCHSLLIMYADPRADYRREAARASKRALELDPDLAEAHASRGLAHLVADEFEAAETEFASALELNPRLYEGYYYGGRAKFHQGDVEQAATLFAKAAEVNPAEYQARCLRVQILRGLGRLDDAERESRINVEVLEKHLKWNPDDVRALHLGAGSLVALGEFDRAKRWLSRALEIDPDDSILLYNVACNYATMGEVGSALDYLEDAVANGMVSAAWIRNDADLDALRAHPRFHSLLARIEALGKSSALDTGPE